MTIGSLPESQEPIGIEGKEIKESKRQGTMQPNLKLSGLDVLIRFIKIPMFPNLLIQGF